MVDIADTTVVLRELMDVWAVHCQLQDDLVAVSEIISNNLSINREQLNQELTLRMPAILLNRDEMVCGRAKLPVRKVGSNDNRYCLFVASQYTWSAFRLLHRLSHHLSEGTTSVRIVFAQGSMTCCIVSVFRPIYITLFAQSKDESISCPTSGN